MAETLRVENPDISFATVMARKGVGSELIGNALGIVAPLGPRWTATIGSTLIGVGPGVWLLRREAAPPGWMHELRKKLDGLASVSDQSSTYSLIRLSGHAARTLLQRGAAIDLHQENFRAGSVATTMIAHIGVIIRQLDDVPSYELAIFRSYAGSFRHWLDQTVATL